MSITLQAEAISNNDLINSLYNRAQGAGALVTFTGYVRDLVN